jgi:hypothetical protein
LNSDAGSWRPGHIISADAASAEAFGEKALLGRNIGRVRRRRERKAARIPPKIAAAGRAGHDRQGDDEGRT